MRTPKREVTRNLTKSVLPTLKASTILDILETARSRSETVNRSKLVSTVSPALSGRLTARLSAFFTRGPFAEEFEQRYKRRAYNFVGNAFLCKTSASINDLFSKHSQRPALIVALDVGGLRVCSSTAEYVIDQGRGVFFQSFDCYTSLAARNTVKHFCLIAGYFVTAEKGSYPDDFVDIGLNGDEEWLE